jgi:serine/threonine protein kinase
MMRAMDLARGAKLGPYEIIGKLGAGGMGEVYRARDERLARDVAVKVLPESMRGDPGWQARFEREARAVGTLSHPNVLAVFDVGMYEGVPFLVSELLEGETLRGRLQRGAMPRTRALETAAALARGLAAAHAKGIVHRDLKPENVFLTRDGGVKILDFGLAKVGDAATGLEKTMPGDSPPPSPGHTMPGAVLGTAGYMAPEQVRGEEADERADLFALGVIAYEMLTGKRAFGGKSAADAMAAVLTSEPAELGSLKEHFSPAIDRVVRRCLEKRPDDRFQSARDLAFALESAAIDAGTPVAASPRRLSATPIALLSAVVAATLGVLVTRNVLHAHATDAQSSASQAVPTSVPVPQFTRLTFRGGDLQGARFVPGGQTVALAAAWDGGALGVYSASAAGSALLKPIATQPGTGILAISTHGDVALQQGRTASPIGKGYLGTLAIQPIDGSTARPRFENVAAADFGPGGDDDLALVICDAAKCRLESPPGTLLYETDGWISDVRVSPDGAFIAFSDHPGDFDDAGNLKIVRRSPASQSAGQATSQPASQPTSLAGTWLTLFGVAWSPRGDEVWFTAGHHNGHRSLYAASLTGQVRMLLDMPNMSRLEDVNAAGRVLMISDQQSVRTYVGAPNLAGDTDLSWFERSMPTDLSTDGRQLLFVEESDPDSPHLSAYIRPIDGGDATRIGEGLPNSFSPDGQSVALASYFPPGLTLVPVGVGSPQPLPFQGPPANDVPFFLPDGQHLVTEGRDGDGPVRLWLLDLAHGSRTPLSPDGKYVRLGHNRGVVAPDGRSVVGQAEDGSFALYPIPLGPPHPLPGLAPNDITAGFTPDGRSIYVYDPDGGKAVVYAFDVATGQRTPVLTIDQPDKAGLTKIDWLLMSRFDRHLYAYACIRELSTLLAIDHVGAE